jgi:phosphoenolpyruvate-protein kinase (PTS system EI component)
MERSSERALERLTGVAASPGIAIGVAHVLGNRIEVYERWVVTLAVEEELARLDEALRLTDEQLARAQQQIAPREVDQIQYRMLEAHRMMLSDVHLVEQARKLIRDQHASAEWAVRKALDQIQVVFERIEDPYFRDRRCDFALVGERLLRNLIGMDVFPSPEDAPKGSVAVAHELSPADAGQLGRAEVAGFCTEGGGRTSHSAIIARTLGLPYVVELEGLGRKARSGMTLLVDGSRGAVILDPDEETLRHYGARAETLRDVRSVSAVPSVTAVPSSTNPAMSLRSDPYSRHRSDLFRTQLRALFRAAGTVKPQAPGPRAAVSVLVVDDDREVRETVTEVLTDEGYTVAAVADGAAALGLLRTVTPEVILLDLNMPTMNGAAFRRAQRLDPALAAIPTVVMTAVDRMKDHLPELVTDALVKPVKLSDLLAVVSRYVRDRSSGA